MLEPDEVAAMVRLRELGWGSKRIALELGCSRNTVKRYLRAGGWVSYQAAERPGKLAGLGDWLSAQFRQHRGNADVLRQELARTHGVVVSLRTVERAVQGLRREFDAAAQATVRYETLPGHQLQIDFGETRVTLGEEPEGRERVRVFVFVATLGYSRRLYVQAFRHERQSAWLDGLEGAFGHFGGVTAEVLMDNAAALVTRHDAGTRDVTFNARLLAFSRHWGFRPRACAPYRARTKGKDERGVGYVKGNAIAGHAFESWGALEGHLGWWMRTVADVRVHGTTGEPPLQRFERDEARALRPLSGRPSFRAVREVVRKVRSDCSIELDTNAYSVPWRLIGESVQVMVNGGRVRIVHAGQVVAEHAESGGRHQRVTAGEHFVGVAGAEGPVCRRAPESEVDEAPAPASDLLRPLAEYEQVAGGGW